ncbi:PP2C family protein-serine/threonine phosphatase [Roseiconus nitratireducens]|nr:protein phosphatase 2C domain-containing protein [Roseiconus nitratireducens]
MSTLINHAHDSFEVAGDSDVGRVRNENQDHYIVGDLRRQLVIRDTDVEGEIEDEMFGCQQGSLLVVADGMGGHEAGERASRIAVQATARYVLDMMRWFLKLSPTAEDDFIDELSESLVSVQKELWSAGPEGHSMGTTVTMAYLLWPKIYVVHAGDSRCYQLRDGVLRQLTTDHTVAQQLLDSGGLNESDPSLQHWRHVLWNCVGGSRKQVSPEAIRADLRVGDQILLCSDGLTGMLDDRTIRSVLEEAGSPEVKVRQLIDLANEAGGTDNITAVICRVVGEGPTDSAGAGLDTTIF